MKLRLCAIAVAVLALIAGASHAATNVTLNDTAEDWGERHSMISQGKMMWVGTGGVMLYNGTTATPIPPDGNADGVATFVFGLGSGASAGDVIGLWRKGTDFAYLTVNGSTPVQVSYTNPYNAAFAMNPEYLSIADGCVFLGLQANGVLDSGGSAILPQTVARINSATGAATFLTPTTVAMGRWSPISSSQCKAVWLWNPQETSSPTSVDLHYWNGSSLETLVSDPALGAPKIARGRIVYTKPVGGVAQVFLYDTTAPSPAHVQLTYYLSGSVFNLTTDGRYVVWTHEGAGGTNRHIVFHGDARLTDGTNKPSDAPGFVGPQLNRGQLYWLDATNTHRVSTAAGIAAVATTPATTVQKPWLTDGILGWIGTSNDGGTDVEVFRHDVGAPNDLAPPRAVSATPGLGSVTLRFSQILGAAHNIYIAREPGVTKLNYASLSGGRVITNATSPYTVTGLAAGTYHMVVTATEAIEGAESAEVSATVVDGVWSRVGSGEQFWDVKADRQNASTLYAAANGGIWKTTNGGLTWAPLPGVTAGRQMRAVVADGLNVVAATRQGVIYRSTDGGVTWPSTPVFAGIDIGEAHKVLTRDAFNPNVIYGGDFRLTNLDPAYLIKSIDGGATWDDLPLAAEIRAYALAGDPTTANRLYVAGTGTPSVARSTDAGDNWTPMSTPGGFYSAAAVGPNGYAYVAGTTFSNGDNDGHGVHKSIDGGANWEMKGNGLPGFSAVSPATPRIYTLYVDPTNSNAIHAGTVAGYFRSTDAAENWALGPTGGSLSSASITSIRAMAITPGRRLVAAALDGLYSLALTSPPSLTNVNPATGGGGQTVTINGSGFLIATGLRVAFDGIDAAIDMGASTATAIVVTTPAHAAGAVDVTVMNPDGQAAVLLDGFTYGTSCTYSVAPALIQLGSGPATRSVNVTAGAGCAWNAMVAGGFLTISGGASGSGNGSVSFDASANLGGTRREGTVTIGGQIVTVVQAPRVSARNDLSMNGLADLLWRSNVTGETAAWLMSGSAITSSGFLPTVSDTTFKIVALGDFQGDGKADVLWRNEASGANAIWFMDGLTLAAGAALPAVPDTNWTIAAVGDWQGDGKDDLMWRNAATGDNAVWLMNGPAVAVGASLPSVPDSNWRIVAVGDLQGDGKDDVVWRNSVTGTNSVWFMNGITLALSASLPTVPDTSWAIAGAGDLQGDGKADLVWRNTGSGDNVVWLMDGPSVAVGAVLTPVPDSNWQIVKIADFQGDGKADFIWRNIATGSNAQWLMNGPGVAVTSALPPVNANWRIAGR